MAGGFEMGIVHDVNGMDFSALEFDDLFIAMIGETPGKPSGMPNRTSTSRSNTPPASEVMVPPSKSATTSLCACG